MHSSIGGIDRLLVFLVNTALPHHTTEADLDVFARTAEPVIKVKMTEGGVEIVAPHEAHCPLAEPHAFGPGRGSRHCPARLGNLVTPGRLLGSIRLTGLGRLVPVLGLKRGSL